MRSPGLVLLGGALTAPPAFAYALRAAARTLAERGHPVLRVHYPGIGISPLKEQVPVPELERTLLEASRWFLERTGVSELSLAGSCLGALMVLQIATEIPRLRKLVGITCPVRPDRPTTTGLRRRARKDADLSPDSPDAWIPGLPERLNQLSERAELEFLYGEEDEFFHDFEQLRESGLLNERARERIRVTTLQGGRVKSTKRIEHQLWISERLVESLDEPEDAR